MTNNETMARISKALDAFKIEIPSWGFANTGTRFGKFVQQGAATTIEEKFADAGMVHQLTGCTPTVGVACALGHAGRRSVTCQSSVTWRNDMASEPDLSTQTYFRHRSTSSARSATRTRRCGPRATEHLLESVKLSQDLGSSDISLWVSDGSNYPGTQSNFAPNWVDGRGADVDCRRDERQTEAADRIQAF